VPEEASPDSTDQETGVAFVYVPTRPYGPATTPEGQEVRFELRGLADGSAGLAVFTDEQALVDQLGSYQPRARVSVLELLVQISRVNVPVVVNPVLRRGAERWTEADIAAWSGRTT
jgi:hypothetical protein